MALSGYQQWTEEILHMLQLFRRPIEKCAMQVYYSALPFMPKNDLIALGYRGELASRIPRVVRGEKRRTGRMVLSGHDEVVRCLAFCLDSRRLVTGDDYQTLYLWDAETGAVIGQPLTGHTRSISCVAFSPDGRRIVSGSEDNTVRFWDGVVNCLAFSPDGIRVISGSVDHKIRLWNPDTGAVVGMPLTGHHDSVVCISYSPDGQLIASGACKELWTPNLVSSDNIVRLWDAQRGDVVGELAGHTGGVRCLAFSPDGRRLASGSYDSDLRLWDITTCAVIGEPLRGHTKPVTCLAYSPDGKQIVSGSEDKALHLWNANDGSLIAVFTGHTRRIICLAYSPDGKWIASGSGDHTVRLWDAYASIPIGDPIIQHNFVVNCLAFSPDGTKLASGFSDRTVHLVDLKAIGDICETVDRYTRGITCLAFSPDGRQLASGSSDDDNFLWNTEADSAIGKPLDGHIGQISHLVYSPDGRYIASVSQRQTIRVWNTNTMALIGEINNPCEVDCIALSPNGEWVVLGLEDKSLQIWDTSTCMQIKEPIQGHIYSVGGVAVSPDGRLIASTSRDRTTRLWDASTRTTLAIIPHSFYLPICHFEYPNDNLLLVVEAEESQSSAVYDVSNPQSPQILDLSSRPAILLNEDGIDFVSDWTTVCGRHSQFRLRSTIRPPMSHTVQT